MTILNLFLTYLIYLIAFKISLIIICFWFYFEAVALINRGYLLRILSLFLSTMKGVIKRKKRRYTYNF